MLNDSIYSFDKLFEQIFYYIIISWRQVPNQQILLHYVKHKLGTALFVVELFLTLSRGLTTKEIKNFA